MRASRTHRLATALIAAVLITGACSDSGGPDDDGGQPDDRSGGAGSTPNETETELVALIETIRDDPGLHAGPGDAAIRITGAARVGDAVLATGARSDEDRRPSGAVLVRSTDGRSWEPVDLPDAEVSLAGVAATGDGAVVVGRERGGGGAFALRTPDGETFERVEVALPPTPPDAEPYLPEAVAASGDSVVVIATGIEVPREGRDLVMTVGVTVSDDGGSTWEAIDVPEGLARQDDQPTVELAVDDRTAWLAFTGVGPDGLRSELWRSDDAGRTWSAVGTGDDLFGGETISTIHPHDGTILVFTQAGGDASLWTLADDGTGFDAVELDDWVLGGAGSQQVDAVVTRDDGTLVAVGRTAGGGSGSQVFSEVEVWVSPDLERWHRSVDDPALFADGAETAAALVDLGDVVVAIGTTERGMTEAERDQEAAHREAGTAVIPAPLARHGMSWVLEVEAREISPAPAEVELLTTSEFEPGARISDAVTTADAIVAMGSVPGDDGPQAAVWRSTDGAEWQRVDAPGFTEPGQQSIAELIAVDGALVAVGWRRAPEAGALAAMWTSPDGIEWTSATAPTDVEGTYAYTVVDVGDDGLLAFGEVSVTTVDEVSRRPARWRSTDGGATWTAAEIGGPAFGNRNIETISSATVEGDGTLIGAGLGTDATLTERGYTYRSTPWVVRSEDAGATWSEVDGELTDGRYGLASKVAIDGDGVLVLGGWEAQPPAGETVGLANRGVARTDGGALVFAEDVVRHPGELIAAAPADFGTVAAGSIRRRGAGSDAVIGIVHGPEFHDLRGEGLKAHGDQEATAAVVHDGRVLVFGVDERAEQQTVLVWEVRPTP